MRLFSATFQSVCYNVNMSKGKPFHMRYAHLLKMLPVVRFSTGFFIAIAFSSNCRNLLSVLYKCIALSPSPWPPEKRFALKFSKTTHPIPNKQHRVSFRKRSGYNKPTSLHVLPLLFRHFSDSEWEGLVYCKRISPQTSYKGFCGAKNTKMRSYLFTRKSARMPMLKIPYLKLCRPRIFSVDTNIKVQ